ncbi:MAG: DNA-3-methyladenine glycosylase 2 family protein [Fuerstiella sp.]
MASGHQNAVRHLQQVDERLKVVIRAVGACRFEPAGGRFEVLARSILAQQISVHAARTIFTRLRRQLPGRRVSARGIAQLSDEQLQAAGISSQKRGYLRDLTNRTLSGQVSFRRLPRLSDDAVIEELIQVKGVGRWTAQMFLQFGLGRPDIFAPDDLGLQNAMKRLYASGADLSRDDMVQIASAWSPWRSIASWYLWRSLELDSDNDLF